MRRVSSRRSGMTLIELLMVIGIIVLIMAMAIPNFGSMMRAQKWAAASSALQNTLLRIQTLAVTDRHDYSAEFCANPDNNSQYFRLEMESAALESIPNMEDYYVNACACYPMRMPVDWQGIFLSSNGRGVTGGTIDTPAGNPWGSWPTQHYLYQGQRYPPYPGPAIQDVNMQNWQSPQFIYDNYKVDDNVYLPYSVLVDFDKSKNLINYDKPPKSVSDMPQYGWDYSQDLRFNMSGMLVQSQNPEIVLKIVQFKKAGSRQEVVLERMRLQVMRSTGRVREISGL